MPNTLIHIYSGNGARQTIEVAGEATVASITDLKKKLEGEGFRVEMNGTAQETPETRLLGVLASAGRAGTVVRVNGARFDGGNAPLNPGANYVAVGVENKGGFRS